MNYSYCCESDYDGDDDDDDDDGDVCELTECLYLTHTVPVDVVLIAPLNVLYAFRCHVN